MELAFAYAQNQFIGLQFEPFTLTVYGLRYRYDGRLNWALRLLPVWVARPLFTLLVEVS